MTLGRVLLQMEKILLNIAMSDTLRAITPADITADTLACLVLTNATSHFGTEHQRSFSMRFTLPWGNVQGQRNLMHASNRVKCQEA